MYIEGPDALPAFQKARLLDALRKVRDDIVDLRARYLHYLDGTPSATDRDILVHLFRYGPAPGVEPGPPTVVVVPRPGTVSPWSSKATDIARACAVTGVQRIERGVAWTAQVRGTPDTAASERLAADNLAWLHDRMTESWFEHPGLSAQLFTHSAPRPPGQLDGAELHLALAAANSNLGLALSDTELAHLEAAFVRIGRLPTEVELMTFAQVNSEHCRHKIFNAEWCLDGELQSLSLFDMIRHTHRVSPGQVLSAYSDNCAVTTGWPALALVPDAGAGHVYLERPADLHIAVKVETHNHPSAISPFPGAATGSGGDP